MTPQVGSNTLVTAVASAESAVGAAASFDDPPPVPLPEIPATVVEPPPKKQSSFRRAVSKKNPASKEGPATEPVLSCLERSSTVPISAPVDLRHQKLTFSGTVREDTSLAAETSLVEAVTAEISRPEQCCELLHEFIKTAVAASMNPATVSTPHLKANMLYLLDKISQQIVATIVNHQNNAANATDPLLFTEYDRALELYRTVSLAELQRHRRQFVKVNSQIPPSNQIDIGASFIEFLALQL